MEFPTAKALVEYTLQRSLKPHETVRFKKGKEKKIALENVFLRSSTATAHEKFLLTGFVPGYSHCLCGCGESLGNPLNSEFQQANPRAYVDGHRPVDSIRNQVQEAAKRPVGWPKGKPRKTKVVQNHPIELTVNASQGIIDHKKLITLAIRSCTDIQIQKLMNFISSEHF